MRRIALICVLLSALAAPCLALDSPWISDTFFYWYSWDYEKELGGWMGGVYNTPLQGYYDSPSYEDNLASLHQASEWGITHHFMDYWGPGWKDSEGNPREQILMEATEALRGRGYDTWMSVYQDGTDFDMAEFSKNMDTGRDAEFYLSRYAKSPAFPKIDGKPVALVYGRNGVPKLTGDTEGFQAYLQDRYESIDALNERWGASFEDFAAVKLDLGAKGHQRAEGIKYQYKVWADEIDRMNAAASDRFDLPGCLFSWDIAYGPFKGFGYSDQTRVFTGPHSYGGIFGVPHQADVERFIQAAVAKRYGTVFFDTFKNFYHDWEIRIPGFCYPPDFNAFDRFWVQVLSHYSEALLHLSWNEWWEGSNLEPCYEYGKTYCEKNLLYATIMKQCFESIRTWNEGAKVAVLLNDWHWLAGGRHPEDIYACIQALRRNNVRFDLIPDDFVTAEELAKFDVILAPSGGVGFGYNAADEPIAGILIDWAQAAKKRKLMIDDYPGLETLLALPLDESVPDGATVTGEDMNVYVDVGADGDEKFLVDGATHPEDWSKLAPDDYGATDQKYTVRWTPGSGLTTSFMMPFSPNRDHVLRLSGSVIWDNHVTVSVDGRRAAEFDISSASRDYEVMLPAAAVGGTAYGELQLKYSESNVPKEKAPEQYESESRVCNMAIDWLQLATVGTPFSAEQNYETPETGVVFEQDGWKLLAGRAFDIPYAPHRTLSDETGTVRSRYVLDKAPRDIELAGEANILYVNGLFSAVENDVYFETLLGEWAECSRELKARGRDITVTPLTAGATDILLAYNYAAPSTGKLRLELPSVPRRPIVEINVLSRDGKGQQEPSRVQATSTDRVVDDEFDYYAVYQVTRGLVSIETPELALVPGQTQRFGIDIQNRVSGVPRTPEVSGKIRLITHLPSLTSNEADFTLAEGKTAKVSLGISARDDADWGEKTVIFDVEVDGRHSYFWRTLTVNRLPDLQVTSPVINTQSRTAQVSSVAFPWAQDADAEDVRLVMGGATADVGTVEPKDKVDVTVPMCPEGADEPAYQELAAGLEYTVGGLEQQKNVTLGFATYPDAYPKAPDAVTPMIVVNPHDEYLENTVVTMFATEDVLDGKPAYVREQGGNVVPSQLSDLALSWVAMLPPKSATLYYLCAGQAPQPETDLRLETTENGLTISNSKLSISWDKTRGGTVTSLVSRATGRDYGAGSFGGGLGTWGKYDPESPSANTLDFVGQEKKLWQRDLEGEATIRVTTDGPVVKVVKVEAETDGVKFEQSFTIGAYQSNLCVMSQISAEEPAGELVPLDIRLARNQLTKIFPNFTGVPAAFQEDSPSAGWREAPYIPPYATMMTPNGFEESVSVIPWGESDASVTKFRQGFWPENRPEAGPVKYAEIELAATDTDLATAHADIVLHRGHQVVGRQYRRTHVDQQPEVILPREFEWEGEVRPRSTEAAGGWWSPYWHFAVPITVGPIAAGEKNPVITLPLPSDDLPMPAGCGAVDLASMRPVVQSPAGVTELPFVLDSAADAMVITLIDSAWSAPAPATREFRLYFDTIDMGRKCAPPGLGSPAATHLLNGSFEDGAKYWTLAGPRLHTLGAHTGSRGVELSWRPGMGPAVISNSTMRLIPNSQYRVTFLAKSTDPQATVRTNFYAGAEVDFPQAAVPINNDGQWHQHTVNLPVGEFSMGIRPALRLWVLDKEQTLYIDDITVEKVGAKEPLQPPIKRGALIAR